MLSQIKNIFSYNCLSICKDISLDFEIIRKNWLHIKQSVLNLVHVLGVLLLNNTSIMFSEDLYMYKYNFSLCEVHNQ